MVSSIAGSGGRSRWHTESYRAESGLRCCMQCSIGDPHSIRRRIPGKPTLNLLMCGWRIASPTPAVVTFPRTSMVYPALQK